MKKLIALLLILTMAFTLAGCVGKSAVGVWTAKVKVSDLSDGSLGPLDSLLQDLSVDLTLELRKDKTFTMTMDASEALAAKKESLISYIKLIPGLDESTLDQAIASMNQSVNGTYVEDDGKLIFRPDEVGLALNGSWSGKTLTLEAVGKQIEFARK
ncbi:MAG: hypothetical protein IKH34_02745 [Oscillospiraceae bacterium]|nr:hypothetical protein [Oscillospiraceae bacterium]